MNFNVKPTCILAAVLLLISCGGSKTERFPMEKPYWGPEEYDYVIREIDFRTPEGEKYPSLSDPELAPVFNRLVSKENISVIVSDNTLGIRHRADFTQEMFDKYRSLINLYNIMNREDKFVYDRELIEILRFGLYLQINYFQMGNESLKQQADNESQNENIIKNNQQIIVSNFINYLDFVNNENSFSGEALESYAAGMDESFDDLLKSFPDSDYSAMLTKAMDMKKKSKNAAVNTALDKLILKLQEKTIKVNSEQ